MSDYFTRDFDTLSSPPRKDHLFLWTVFILLLTGFAMACWLGSFYIFGHPEDIRSYKILLKLHKLDPPKRFDITEAPPGEFLSPQKLYERYNSYPPLRLQAENNELLRMYIDNYQNNKKLVPYIVGRFTIIDAHQLTPNDFFTSGVAAVAASADFPQVLLEHVYTSDSKDVPALLAMLKTGLDVKLARTLDLAAIIHIQRLDNGSLQFTAVPLLYGSYALRDSEGTFSLQPPPGVNLIAGLPILRGAEMDQDLLAYAQYQQQHTPVSSALDQPLVTPSATPNTSSELVRVNANPAPEISIPLHARRGKGHASPSPGEAIATASAQPQPTAQQPVLAMGNQPVVAQAVPVATPPVSPNGVPLTPFLQSAPAPVLADNGASWRMYAPGQMPVGRVIDPSDAAPLADSGLGGERLYLRGDFVVTASEENRAVLRPQSAGLASLIKPGATRVIVEYPAGVLPPTEGSAFSRDETRPFMITDVRRGADGQINLYVREITTP
ncbi:MAG: hypothetical protein ABSE62_07765 [Chthoniobacteraceae bacterium]|jgi:hypothetical protein